MSSVSGRYERPSTPTRSPLIRGKWRRRIPSIRAGCSSLTPITASRNRIGECLLAPHRRAPGVMGETVSTTIQSGAIQRGGKTGKGNWQANRRRPARRRTALAFFHSTMAPRCTPTATRKLSRTTAGSVSDQRACSRLVRPRRVRGSILPMRATSTAAASALVFDLSVWSLCTGAVRHTAEVGVVTAWSKCFPPGYVQPRLHRREP